MKLKIAVVAAFVYFVSVVFATYMPGFPITVEFINSILVIMLGWLGVEVVELVPFVQNLINKLRVKGLW